MTQALYLHQQHCLCLPCVSFRTRVSVKASWRFGFFRIDAFAEIRTPAAVAEHQLKIEVENRKLKVPAQHPQDHFRCELATRRSRLALLGILLPPPIQPFTRSLLTFEAVQENHAFLSISQPELSAGDLTISTYLSLLERPCSTSSSERAQAVPPISRKMNIVAKAMCLFTCCYFSGGAVFQPRCYLLSYCFKADCRTWISGGHELFK